MGNEPLCDLFPRLYSISSFKEGLVGEMWREKERWCEGVWGWRRRLFVWEQNLLQQLIIVLPPLVLSGEEDAWRWRLEDDGVFSVKSVYLLLGNIFAMEPEFGTQELRVFNNIWKSPVPSKVIAFAWKLLRNRIPTRVNLLHRGVEVNGGVVSCVFCQRRDEDASHLFLFCDFAAGVWKAIFRWLGVVIVIPPTISILFDCLTGAAGSKKKRSGFSLVWHATIWAIWRSRNNVIFSNGIANPEELVDEIKLVSWRWGLSRHKIPICLFYKWCWDPGLVLGR
jgi:hypothetical protein